MALSLPPIFRNPIFERDFVAVCRTKRWFLLRTALVTLLTLTLWLFLAFTSDDMDFRDLDQIGRSLFATAAFTQIIFVFLVTPGLTADLIVSERRKDTLDILLVTTIRPFGIVLGKLASRLALLLLVIVAASFPVICVSLLYGGVRVGQVVGLFAVTVGTVLLLAGPSLLISSFAKKLGTAAFVSYILPIVMTLVLPVLAFTAGEEWIGDAERLLAYTHVLGAATAVAVDEAYIEFSTAPVAPHFVFLGMSAVIATLCVAVAVFRLRLEGSGRGHGGGGATRAEQVERDLIALRRLVAGELRGLGPADRAFAGLSSVQDRIDALLVKIRDVGNGGAGATPRKTWLPIAMEVREVEAEVNRLPILKNRRRLEKAATRTRRGRFRRLFVNVRNPMLWKEANLVNASHSRVLFIIALGVLVLGEVLVFLASSERVLTRYAGPHVLLATCQGMVLLVLVSINAGTSVIGEREQGTLDLLRVTMLTAGQITTAKVVGAVRSVMILALLPIGHLLIAATISPISVGSVIGYSFTLSVLITFFAVWGVHASVVSKKASRAILRSMGLLGALVFGAPLAALFSALLSGFRGVTEFLLFMDPAVLLYFPADYLAENTGTGMDSESFLYTLIWLVVYVSVGLTFLVRLPGAYRKAAWAEE